MRIKKIRLANGYKRFHDLTIDLGDNPKRIVALIGPNGCGKSSVFDGMLYCVSPYGQIGNKGGKDYEYHSMHRSQKIRHNDITIDLAENEFQKIINDRQSNGSTQTIFSFRSPYRYNSILNVKQISAVPDIKLNNYGATNSVDLDDKMESSYRRLYAKLYKYIEEQDVKPSEGKKKIISELNTSIGECLDLEISSVGNVENSQGTLFFKKSNQSTLFNYNVLSSGEKEVVDILLDLYLRAEEYNDTVFLFDEPDLHISTAIQKKLLVEMNRLVGENCQLWVSTHSIGFMRALHDELKDECQIIRFEQDIDYATAPLVLKPVESSFRIWKEIFAVALDDMAHLVAPKRIFYCEGKDKPGRDMQEQGLDANVLNSIFSNEFSDSLFVSSGGNTEPEQRSKIAISILSKVFPTIEICVLLDRDISSGKPTTENDRQHYLKTNPTNHRVLKRWEIENYLYDKEVLKKYCAANSLVFAETHYDAFVTDITNQNLKDETGRIKNYCGISTSINAEMFKLALSKFVTPDMDVYRELKECIFDRA